MNLLLIIVFILLLLLSFFFAGSETSMMALNRYRLKHLAKYGNKKAQRAQKLLETPDRLLSMIITVNTCATIFASAILTYMLENHYGQVGVLVGTLLLTLFILIFCEALPKTMCALRPEKFALPATLTLKIFVICFAPVIWFIHKIVNAILKIFNLSNSKANDHLSTEELHTLIKDSGSRIPENYQNMLLQVLELEQLTVADIMIPCQDLAGIDMNDDDETVLQQLLNSPYRDLPVYRKDFNDILGLVKIREVLPMVHDLDRWSKDILLKHLMQPYVVPETTPLHKQLTNFRKYKKRNALVVDEYGEILGMVTIEDLLEEIVGEFTTDFTDLHPDIIPQKDGSFLVNGHVTLRELNKYFHWHLPKSNQKTLAGYLVSYLQMIPESGTMMLLENHPVEILQVVDNRIKIVKIHPLNKSEPRALAEP